jgi:hypothetical protein
VGTTVPDVEIQTLEGLTRIGVELRSMDFLLVDLTGADHFRDGKYGELPVHVINGVPSLRPESLREVKAMLVRPDGYIAWATAGEADLEQADAALAQWMELPR